MPFLQLKIRYLQYACCAIICMATLGLAASPVSAAPGCDGARTLGVARTIEIDATNGPLFGDLTRFSKEDNLLRPREVLLTFDDGPMPWVTRSILDTLDRFCTKATFFSVGKMALAYPDTVRDVMARGHTLGTHTWSHPLNLRRLSIAAATEEVERGFAAVSAAAGKPIAPFFRFPGLSDSGALLTHLQRREVATFTVDVVSNDSYIADSSRLIRETLAKVEAQKGGIILFHDIKVVTAKALPAILSELKARGYSVVHVVSKHGFVPNTAYAAEYAAKLAHAGGRRKMMPFFGTTGPVAGGMRQSSEDGDRLSTLGGSTMREGEVTELAPEGRVFQDSPAPAARSDKPKLAYAKSSRPSRTAVGDGWSTVIRRETSRTMR
jgi:peptidoglycan-N-acetylglucosamine deacetylase